MLNFLKFLIHIAEKSSCGLTGRYRGHSRRIKREYKFAARWSEFDWYWVIKEFSDDEFSEFLYRYSERLDLNFVDRYGHTPMEKAIRSNASLEKIKLLIKYGANPSMRLGYREMTYMHIAASVHSDPMLIEEFVKYLPIDVLNKHQEPPIFYASMSQSNWGVIRKMLDFGADLNFQTSEGDCITFSLMLNDRNIFDKFFEVITQSLSVEEVRQKLSYILVNIFNYAFHGGEYPVEKRVSDSEYLISLGAQPNFFEGENALMYWVNYRDWFKSADHIDGKKELIECLLQQGLDPNGPDQSGRFFESAIEHDINQPVKYDGALRLLFKYKANPNIPAGFLFGEPKAGNLMKKALSTKKPVYIAKLLLENGNKFYTNCDLVIDMIYNLHINWDRRKQHQLKIISGLLREYGKDSLENQGVDFLKRLSEKLGKYGPCLPAYLFETILKMDQKIDLFSDADSLLEVCCLGDRNIFDFIQLNGSLVDSKFMDRLALRCRSPEVFEILFHFMLEGKEVVENCNFLSAGALNYNQAAAVKICELAIRNSDKFSAGFGATTKDGLLFRANCPQIISLLVEYNCSVNQIDASGKTPLVQQLLSCEFFSEYDTRFLEEMNKRRADRRINVIKLLEYGANPLAIAKGKVRQESNALIEIIELINCSTQPEYWMEIFNNILQIISSDKVLISSFRDQRQNLPKLKVQEFLEIFEEFCKKHL